MSALRDTEVTLADALFADAHSQEAGGMMRVVGPITGLHSTASAPWLSQALWKCRHYGLDSRSICCLALTAQSEKVAPNCSVCLTLRAQTRTCGSGLDGSRTERTRATDAAFSTFPACSPWFSRPAHLERVVFANNTAMAGAALFISEGAHVTLHDCDVTDTHSFLCGGAFLVSGRYCLAG